MRYCLGWLLVVFGLTVSTKAYSSCTPLLSGSATCTTEGEAAAWASSSANFTTTCAYYYGTGAFHDSSRPTETFSTESYVATYVYCKSASGVEQSTRQPIKGTFTEDCSTFNLGLQSTQTRAQLTQEGEKWPSCLASCQFTLLNATTVTMPNGAVLSTGSPHFSGNICPTSQTSVDSTAPPPPNNPDTQSCVQVPGQTMCLQPNGQVCATASSGNQYCWTPGTPISQTAPDGEIHTVTPTIPSGTPPAGTSLNSSVPISSSVSTGQAGGAPGSTTTNNNYSNIYNNTPADPVTPPAPGTASGGTDCGSPPACSNDAVGCAQLFQLWRNACALGTTVTAGGSCNTPYICSGVDQAQCAILKETQQIKCAMAFEPESDAAITAGMPSSDSLSGVTAPSGEFGLSDVVKEDTPDLTQLNEAGFGLSRSCPALDWPTLTIRGKTFNAPWPSICSWLSVLSYLIILVGYAHATYIISGK